MENYLDENEFRRWLNSAVQNSRGVTFLLQKQKAQWSDFAIWYGQWQDAAREDPVLQWGVTARNRIVKEEDLTTMSQAVVSVYDTRRMTHEDTWLVPSNTPVKAIIAMFVNLAEERPARRRRWLRVQRRWIDDQLPDYELVAALRELYRSVAAVLQTAHDVSGVAVCDAQPFPRACINRHIDPHLTCLGSAVPAMVVDVQTGEVTRIEYGSFDRDVEVDSPATQRYGAPPRVSNDPIEYVADRMNTSKVYLESDGYVGPMLLLFKGHEVRVHLTPFDDEEPRELKIRAAIEANGAWQFDGAVFASETWLGYPGDRGRWLPVPASRLLPANAEFFNADSRGDREEALIVVGLAADGRSRVLTLPFGRVMGGYVFGNAIEDVSGNGIPGFLSPVWDHWT